MCLDIRNFDVKNDINIYILLNDDLNGWNLWNLRETLRRF